MAKRAQRGGNRKLLEDKDLVGEVGRRYGRLIVTGYFRKQAGIGNYKENTLFYKCVCDCGKKCNIRAAHIRKKHTMSCGCLQLEIRNKYRRYPTQPMRITKQRRLPDSMIFFD